MPVGKSFKTQGTDLYFNSPGSPGGIVRVGCITEAPDPVGGAAPQIDTTCLESIEREFERGLPTPASSTFTFILDGDSEAHDELFDLKTSGEVIEWYLGMSDATTDPTLDSSGNIEHPADRSGFIFSAYVEDLTLPGPLDEVYRGTVTLQRSGAPNRQILPTA